MSEGVVAVLPAYNEETRVGATVRALVSTGRFLEVVVVDDGSTDATAEVAAAAGARVMRIKRNRGKGAAVATALRETRAPVVLLCDADLQDTAAALTALLDPILDGSADMTIAAPPREGKPSGFGLVESFARWGIERATKTRMERPLSGQRAVRRSALPLAPGARGFGLEVGLTIDAIRSGARVVEIPVSFRHARTGRDIAGFVHRIRQGLDIMSVLADRLRRRGSPPAGEGQ